MNTTPSDSTIHVVESPSSTAMDALCQSLHALALETDRTQHWPARQLNVCGRAGVFRWFMPRESGGFGWDACDQTRGYLRLAAADLTTTFVITQRMGACRRIDSSENKSLADSWLPGLLDGSQFATVGISHLTTSRQHVRMPVLTAEETGGDFILNGYSPWVTGGAYADVIVVGGTLPDGRQLLAAVPSDRKGVSAGKGMPLVALSASATDRVDFDNVAIHPHELIAGPVHDVMSQGVGAASGGLQTSTLAVGLASAAIAFMQQEAERRDDLKSPAEQLAVELTKLQDDLLRLAHGDEICSTADLRGRANRLVLRATQAALTSAKGAGFVQGHPAGRWCIEAMFFLVWSCPQPIAHAHLCELAGIE